MPQVQRAQSEFAHRRPVRSHDGAVRYRRPGGIDHQSRGHRIGRIDHRVHHHGIGADNRTLSPTLRQPLQAVSLPGQQQGAAIQPDVLELIAVPLQPHGDLDPRTVGQRHVPDLQPVPPEVNGFAPETEPFRIHMAGFHEEKSRAALVRHEVVGGHEPRPIRMPAAPNHHFGAFAPALCGPPQYRPVGLLHVIDAGVNVHPVFRFQIHLFQQRLQVALGTRGLVAQVVVMSRRVGGVHIVYD